MPDRIRVVQMVYDFHVEKGGGGVTRSAIDLALALDREHFQSRVLGLGHTGSEGEERRIRALNEQGIPAAAAALWQDSNPYRSFLKAYCFLKNELSIHPADILHSHSEFTDIAVLLLKAQRRVPVALRTTHYGYPIEWRNRPGRRALFTNLLYPLLFDCEIGVSPALQQRLNSRRIAVLAGRRALYINEAVRLERFQGIRVDKISKKRSLGIPSNARLVGCIGRLAEQKGHSYLLQAAALLLNSQSDVFFLLIGDGPLAQELLCQARLLQIEDRIIFVGSRTDVEELLACFDLFVLPSLWEAMPISVLESMAAGTAVVATDVPGTRDLIRDGENGRLVPPRDPSALSQAIRELLEAPWIRQAMAKKALVGVQDFSIHAVAGRYAELYHSLHRVRRK